MDTEKPKKSTRPRARAAYRAAIKRGATRCSCCEIAQIIDFYDGRKEGMSVDHIKPVSKGGKHCLKNMQYMGIEENRKKGSKYEQ